MLLQVRLPRRVLSKVRVLAAESLFDCLELCLLTNKRTCHALILRSLP